eukprot:COSAG01_NODE_35644_length_528_cov_367.060606_1_plen_27_part_01
MRDPLMQPFLVLTLILHVILISLILIP